MNGRVLDFDSSLREHAYLQMETLARSNIECKVCGCEARPFDVVDFSKTCNPVSMPDGPSGIPVYYHRCETCGFVFTVFFDGFTSEQWRRHIYNNAYYEVVDPEYDVKRPAGNAEAIDALLWGGKDHWLGLDYGGGNGRTAQLLRQKGFRYETFDPFGEKDLSSQSVGEFNFCSVFEVAEHAPCPNDFLKDIVRLCVPGKLAILVGTHVVDGNVGHGRGMGWWYAAPRNGHISLHSRRSLSILAENHGFSCLSLTEQTHFLTRGYSASEARMFLLRGKLLGRARRIFKS